MRNLWVSPRVLVALFLTLSVLMVAVALIEYRQSRRELESLMKNQAHTVLEGLLVASDNAMNANDEVNALVQQRLLDHADQVRRLYEQGGTSQRSLADLANRYQLERIDILDRRGALRQSSRSGLPEVDSASVAPILDGTADTLLIGLHAAKGREGFLYSVVLATAGNDAVVVSQNANGLKAFQRDVGFGYMLRRVSMHPGIEYVALQDTFQILAAAGKVEALEPIGGSDFLLSALRDTALIAHDRILRGDSLQALEVVMPFSYRGMPVGLFRLGLSMEPVAAIDAQIGRRLLFLTLVILAIGFVVLTFIVSNQNHALLQKQYRAVETYSSRVIEHVSDGIIVYDADRRVRTVNRAAQEIFQRPEWEVVGQPVGDLFRSASCEDFLGSPALLAQLECELDGRQAHLLVARAAFEDERGALNHILVVRDLTRQRQLESQVEHRAKLSAIGEMAGGLAHEIRNPLNAVGTIVQQLESEFAEQPGGEEYRELLSIVHQEVRRINESVQNFLQMVRPEPIRPELFSLTDLLSFVEAEYRPVFDQSGMTLEVQGDHASDVHWDRRQMQQVIMNLIQNALDAGQEGGHVAIQVERPVMDVVEIRVSDDGAGIPEEIRGRIFDLYFTTKKRGTGIGLSLVQRIVGDHGGTIEIESREGKGATFILRLPRWLPPA